MQRKTPLVWLLIMLLFLAACGGSAEEEPAATTSNGSTSSTTDTASAETEAEAETEAAPADESAADETEADEDAAADEEEAPAETGDEAEASDAGGAEAEAEPAAETANSPWGDRPLSGVDPETGLTVNPPSVEPGDTVLIRGEVISLNLTPASSPEFLIQSPEGVNYRIRSQSLDNTAYEDGTEIPPHLFKMGMLAQATITKAADATVVDLATSEDLTIINTE